MNSFGKFSPQVTHSVMEKHKII